jgi:hypothetical protein
MSVAETTDQVLDRSKIETRRLGWKFVKPGDVLTLVDRNPRTGKPWQRLADVEVLRVTLYSTLCFIDQASVIDEGFPDLTPEQFVEFFCRTFKCEPRQEVTVIRWRYL